MNINSSFPSEFLRAADIGNGEIGDEIKLTMDTVTMETVGDDTKPVVHFRGTDKGLVLNKTNANTIAGMFGPETEAWSGQVVTLFVAQAEFQGKQTLAIRVKMQKAKSGKPFTGAAPAGTNGSGDSATTNAKMTAPQVVEWCTANATTYSSADRTATSAKIRQMARDIGCDLSAAQNLQEAFMCLFDFAKGETAPF